ncbi:hypothetical protein KCMC57_63980 (plasmid) [Kitasatospora sp. CMC57]|uniref:Uncharacterized protein n=1 Tax=Kitasatospora sp. CMC57 TaxID=3231513 RepID=A0AB33K756_9ACTN
MSGYAGRLITLDFPELTEEGGAPVRVVIRNPKTLPWHELIAPDTTEEGAVGTLKASYEVIARVVTAWTVYDATSNDEQQPLLGLPATPELVAKLPRPITERIIDLLNGVERAGA